MQNSKEKFTIGLAIKNILIGVVLGVSNIIPGVSGGTMAVVTGVFDKLIAILTFDFKFIKQQWKFIATLLLGMGFGVIGFSWIISYCLEQFPIATNLFFVGVVFGTCPLIGKKAFGGKANTAIKILPCVLMIIGLTAMAVAENSFNEEAVAILPQNFSTFVFLFFVMILAAAAMIVPGVSGSFVALALGAYPTVISAIKTLNIVLLLPIGAGIVIGLIGGAKLIKWLLEKYPTATYSAILGLLIGSVISLMYPLLPTIAFNFELLAGILIALFGFYLAYCFCKSEDKK